MDSIKRPIYGHSQITIPTVTTVAITKTSSDNPTSAIMPHTAYLQCFGCCVGVCMQTFLGQTRSGSERPSRPVLHCATMSGTSTAFPLRWPNSRLGWRLLTRGISPTPQRAKARGIASGFLVIGNDMSALCRPLPEWCSMASVPRLPGRIADRFKVRGPSPAVILARLVAGDNRLGNWREHRGSLSAFDWFRHRAANFRHRS
jgi:hypothetical protein